MPIYTPVCPSSHSQLWLPAALAPVVRLKQIHDVPLIRLCLVGLFASLSLIAEDKIVHYNSGSEEGDVRIGWNDEMMLAHFEKEKGRIEHLATRFMAEPELRSVDRYTAFTQPRKVVEENPEKVAEYRNAARRLGFWCGIRRDPKPDELRLRMKIAGLLDSSTEKGIAYRATRPLRIAQDLDLIRTPEHGVTYYRPIEGRWYLYLHYEK